MAVIPGTRLGPYEITAQIGVGGMGEVYRAMDTNLKRAVAIKVLPELVAEDRERLARFQREAEVLASLNHPNIAAIYGLERSDGVTALVMELVEGPTLAERIARGPIPVDEALPIARQIAEALEAAHEHAVIHRDLKPANIKVRDDGTVKVLDFGLAKALEPMSVGMEATASPTITSPAMTQRGVILGTAAYMSPEQARGKPVDKRADIWAFGCVLYEMLTGRRAFDGVDVADTLGTVLKVEPDWATVPPESPATIRRLLTRCLVKDPRARQRDVGDILLDLEEASQKEAASPAPVVRRVAAWVPWFLAAAFGTAVVAFLVQGTNPTSGVSHGTRRFTLDLPWQDMPNWGDFRVRVSPQGTHLAYPGSDENRTTINLRSLDSLTTATLVGSRADPWNLAFSPDGARLAFLAGTRLQTVSARGGQPEPVAEIPFEAEGISWGLDGSILAGGRGGLVRVPASGGAVEPVAAAKETEYYIHPFHLPNGTHALISIVRTSNVFRLAVVDLMTGDVRELALQGVEPIYSSTGHLLFRQEGKLFAVPFDLESLEVRGQATSFADRVAYGPHLSEDGTLVYVAERVAGTARLVWVDRRGLPSPIPRERRAYTHIDLAGNGTSVLLDMEGTEFYASELNRGSRNLVANGSFPVWHPDGERATFHDFDRDTIYMKKADGSGTDVSLVQGVGTVPTSWSPDGRYLAFFDPRSDVWILPSGGKPKPLLSGPANERSARFSPDGRALAYVSDETGEFQVYVTPFPDAGSKTVVSVDGGLEPLWSSDGKELYFRQGSKVMAARVRLVPTIEVSPPVELFDGPYTLDLSGHQRWDVAPDGRFLMVENSEDFQVVIVEGFFEELRRLVPTN